ncbi:MAG: Hpt domain-containing protein [Bdellovibrionales bacterium]|nr:Hpt domain-containing protein [Bdellovibrionales bacterium]
MQDDEKPEEGLEDLVDSFLQSRIAEYELLQSSLSNKDFDTIQSYMHKWKGFCGPYGFGPLAKLSADLEEAAMEQSYDHCEKLLKEIHLYLKKRSQK